MAYSSWLRSYFCARNTAIVLGIVLIATALVRVSLGANGFVAMDAPHGVTFSMGPTDILLDVALTIALMVGLVVATILAGPLARENSQHLEIAWTKPVSRTRYALEAVLANLCGMWAAQILTVIVAMATAALFIGMPFAVGAHTAQTAALAFFGPIAWYAMYLAVTSSLKRGLGAVQGLAWPAAFLLPGLSVIGMFPGSPLALRVIHYIFTALNFLNPMHYVNIVSSKEALLVSEPSFSLRITMLIVLAIAYGIVGILQWNRVEA